MAVRDELALLLGSAVFVAATAGLVLWDRASIRASDGEGLRLHAVEQDGRIRVDWDPADPAIRSASSATLVAKDGNASHKYEVPPEALRGGGLDYLRRSNDVLLTLRIDGGMDSALRTVVAAPPPPLAAAPAPPKVTRTRRR